MSSFTDKQLSVINFNEGNIIVSASAGSGKTSVMIERIIRLIVEGKANIREILAVTFTKLASKEIKERISRAIIKNIPLDKTKRLKSQLEDVSLASISTIDSFCSALIKKYFYACSVAPDFVVLDQTEAVELKSKAINETFEELYENDDSDLIELLKIFVKKRSDRKLKEVVLSFYDFVISEEDKQAVFEKSLNAYTAQGLKECENRLIAQFLKIFDNLSQSLGAIYKNAKQSNVLKLEKAFAKYFEDFSQIKYSKTASQLLQKSGEIKFRFPTLSANEKNELSLQVKDEYAVFKTAFDKVKEKLSDIFEDSQEDRLRYALGARDILQKLIRLVGVFEQNYSRLKQELGALDFDDLEHVALEILSNEEILEEVKSTYKYIFVDEYQDTNGVQEAIFAKIKNDNLFIVGDVKQSIYAFRGCNPKIFNSKIENAQTNGDTHVDLDSNFRSSKAVINAVNKVFCGVMHKENSGVEYSQSKMLGGSLYGDNLGEAILHVVPKKQIESENVKGVYSIEKHLEKLKKDDVYSDERIVSQIIEEQVGKKFYDIKSENKDKNRLIEYGDITILTRANKGIADKIVKELVSCGIPVSSQSKRSIGEYPEIKLMMNLVEFIVRPTSDVSLATVLHSKIGGFSNDELSAIKKRNKGDSFFDSVMKATKSGEFAQRLNEFFEYFEKIRLLAQFESASSLISRILRERNYEVDLLSSNLGEIKLSRINRLLTTGENMSIFEFYEKLDSIIKSLSASTVGGENAVKIMSYHASKGLEFPVVIIPDVSKNFSTQDFKEEILFDRDLGIGLKFYDTLNMLSKKTLFRAEIDLKKKLELVTEEMRLFYVALTRAKYNLHLISEKMPAKNHRYENYIFANKMSDFLSGCDMQVEDKETDLLEQAKKLERRALVLGAGDETIKNQMREFLSFDYRYNQDVTLSLKRSVTDILSKERTGLKIFEDEPLADKPLFSDKLNELGTAYHRFLEVCNFEKTADNQLIELVTAGKITKEQQNLLDINVLNKILQMPIFTSLANKKLYREQPFIINVPAKLLGVYGSEEKVLVQGIIDLLVVFDDQAYIIDYKYSSKDKASLIETYRKQLELYAYATSEILNLPVTKKVIVNIRRCEDVEL